MKPRRTHASNRVYRLEGGTEDNDLWVEQGEDQESGWPLVKSVWEPSREERELIAGGGNIELVVWGAQQPVALGVTTEPLGRPPGDGAAQG